VFREGIIRQKIVSPMVSHNYVAKPPHVVTDFTGEHAMKSPVIKRSIVLAGHKTSVSLEDPFWNALKEIAGGRDSTLSDLVTIIDADRQHANLSSAIRLFVLEHYRDQSSDYRSERREQLVA
jgi:predicted DNA-binding ribbon-helix-helix protein